MKTDNPPKQTPDCFDRAHAQGRAAAKMLMNREKPLTKESLNRLVELFLRGFSEGLEIYKCKVATRGRD